MWRVEGVVECKVFILVVCMGHRNILFRRLFLLFIISFWLEKMKSGLSVLSRARGGSSTASFFSGTSTLWRGSKSLGSFSLSRGFAVSAIPDSTDF